MASSQIYMQKMFADLQTAMAGMSSKFDNQITELQNVVTAAQSGVAVLNIKSTDRTKTIAVIGEKTQASVTAFTIDPLAKIVSRANGSAFAQFNVKFVQTGTVYDTAIQVFLRAYLNGVLVASGANAGPITSGQTKAASVTFQVKENDLITFDVNGSTSNTGSPATRSITVNGGQIEYGQMDIFTQGAFVNV